MPLPEVPKAKRAANAPGGGVESPQTAMGHARQGDALFRPHFHGRCRPDTADFQVIQPDAEFVTNF